MKPLIFASNNQHKVDEIRSVLPSHFAIKSLKEAGIGIDIAEPYDKIEENAHEKARVIYKMTGTDCFAEDTGLFIDALNGEPGVRSARYAGEEKSDKANVDKVLSKMGTSKNRKAFFKTVICAIINGENHFFEGICTGEIAWHRSGDEGFGYDPIFRPEGSLKTFAEMKMDEKNKYSHRQKAMNQFIDYLKKTDNGSKKLKI